MFGKKEETITIDQNKVGELLQLATLASVLKTQSFLTTNGYNQQEKVVQLTERTIWTTSVALLTQALKLANYQQYQALLQQALINYLQEPHSKFDLETVKYVLKTFQSNPRQFDNYLNGITDMARQSLLKVPLPFEEHLLTLTKDKLQALHYNISCAIALHLPHAKMKIGNFKLPANARFCADTIQLATMIDMLGFKPKTVFNNLHQNDISTDKSLSKTELAFYQKYVNPKKIS